MEPIPEAYEQCLRNRPLATVVNCACVSNDYAAPTVEMVYAGLMSIVRGARSSDEADEEWISRGETLQAVERYTCSVPARTLTSVLDEHGLDGVDLLSLDVEGYEVEVLKGLDLERFSPRHILVEESDRGEVARYLASQGYRHLEQVGHEELTRDVLYERPWGLRRGIGGLRRALARRTYFRRLPSVTASEPRDADGRVAGD